jgi:prolyl oligopeptidase
MQTELKTDLNHEEKMRKSILTFVAAMTSLTAIAATAQPITYPDTRQVAQTDNYHGTTVADPYRWLEDDNSADTKAWVKAQNAVTDKFLEAMPQRLPVRKIYTALYDLFLES